LRVVVVSFVVVVVGFVSGVVGLRAGLVVVVDVVGVVVVDEVGVVVVVVGVSQTVMVTVAGKGPFSTVLAEGLWLCTVPGVPPLWLQSTWVKAGVSPATPEIAELAAPCVS
jgi:hypothetical protein